MRKLVWLFLFLPLFVVAQKKQITLEDIYKNRVFRGEPVNPDFDEPSQNPAINFDILKDENGKPFGQPDDVIYSVTFPDAVIIRKNVEPIYRYSSKAHVYYYNATSGRLILLDKEKLMHPTLSPDGKRIAYVKNNNLYLYEIAAGKTTAVTTDGKWNHIINGNCDWVYEEEFSFTQAYQWSPEGSYLAYYRFDETNVKEYEFTQYDDYYNSQYRYKYPKAGEDNSVVDIYIYHIATGRKVKAQFDQGDIYIPRIKWTRDDNTLCVFWMNRHQNHLKLLLTNAQTGAASLMYEEKNKYYIDINDDLRFLSDKKTFLFTSEMNGYQHIYLYSLDGKTKVQLTKDKYDVADVLGVDEKKKMVYYTQAWPTPMDRNLFATDFTGKKTMALTQGSGWRHFIFNTDFTKYYEYKSTLNTPQLVTLHELTWDKKKGLTGSRQIKLVTDNSKLKAKMEEYDLGKAEFIRVPNRNGDTLNGWMLKPPQFDPSKKYPVLFCNYGGPGSQTVTNRFGSVSFWHQLLAQRGFIVVSVDNTGTGFRGEAFKNKTYLQLGKFEIEDQIDAAKYLGQMPFVDKEKIGHWGWSYGGFMSSLAVTKGADVFAAGVAVAPVTSWRYYDNIYTERYMRTPQENPSGYDDNSPIHFTDKIKGKYLIIHGTADDNVHFQNSVQMIKALVKSNVDFESAYYPDKNHGISGSADNTTYHLWRKMSKWIIENLGNENTKPLTEPVAKPAKSF